MAKKILFISTVFPYPKDNGKKIILSSILEYFLFKYGEKNVHITLIGNNEVEESNTSFNIIKIDKPKMLVQLYNVIYYCFLRRNKSIQEAVLYSKKIEKQLNNSIKNLDYELYIYDTVRIAQFFEDNTPLSNEVVYLDDLFSIRYEKMLKILREFPNIDLNPLGNFKKILPNRFSSLIKFKFITKILLKIEKNLVRKSEIRVSERFKRSLLISEDEVEFMNENFRIKSLKSIKPLLKENLFNRKYYGDNKDFIFLGNLSVAHNDVSIINFINKNIEKMIEHDINLKIIGKNPTAKLLELEKKYRNIQIIGYVEDLNYEFSKACGMVIPLIFGTGVKLKTLEAFSYGLPIITTDYGVEGISLPHNKEENPYILENNVEDYWRHMLSLSDKTLNETISKSSYLFFKHQYSKKEIYKQYNELFSVENDIGK
ncbi:glycosyltransferase [Metabacillus halosaccharovorans]|uniref:glycosyltransferase n=1 Tax=Metabacillus halosaccharovorans TaxID=930124 RepID=UPI001C1FE3C3|nr:glycosyltransferase [Metabacillus halosaccharovorans]MBU7594463.1 glycosyltransferase family 4 protein [Metabacillus halosaccharovorans]